MTMEIEEDKEQGGEFSRFSTLTSTDDATDDATGVARDNVDEIVRHGSAVIDGAQAVWRECFGLAGDLMSRQLDGFSAMASSQTIPDFHAARIALVNDGMALVFHRLIRVSTRISALSMRMSQEALAYAPGRDVA